MIQRPPDRKLSEIAALATEAAWDRTGDSAALKRLHELLDGATIHWLIETAEKAERLEEQLDAAEAGF